MAAVSFPPSSLPLPPQPQPSLAERQRRLGEDLDAIKARVFARVGAEDVSYVKRLNYASRALEVIGRGLIHFSFEPITFSAGVIALWLHKQLQGTEIGHTALHGAYDKLPGGEKFASKTFSWDTPIDEESWRKGHNLEHHGNTNVAGRDPDVDFGIVRLTDKTPHRPIHRWQFPLTLAFLFPNFGLLMNLHFTGMDQPKENRPKDAVRKTLRKYVPYYAKNYVLFPLLAGPFWWKVLLGNWLAETMRDIYSAATIFCGHIGDDVASWAQGTKPRSRGEWYAMQIAATNNYEVPLPISVLCGGLDRQIEHHLFPTLPPPRLREIAPEVRAACERHGFEYKTGSWPKILGKALRHLRKLSNEGGTRAVLREMA